MEHEEDRGEDPGGSDIDIAEFSDALSNQKRQDAIETYRQNILVSESAIQANRLIVNLEKLFTKKAKKGENTSDQMAMLEERRKNLIASLQNGDANGILEIESSVEQSTLTYDPLYLESEDARREERRVAIDERQNAGWMSNQSSRLIQIMRGDTKGEQTVTRAERRSCISKAAWTFAVSGMVIAIAFLIVDFYSAQTNPVLRTNLIAKDEIILPQTTFCMGIPNIGSFRNAGTLGIRGKPLFGVASFNNLEASEKMNSNEAHAKKFEHVIVGPETCHKEMTAFSDAQMMFQRSSPVNITAECYSCYRVSRSQAIKLKAERAKEIGRPPVQVTMAKSRLLDYCFSNVSSFHDLTARNAILGELKEYSAELEREGILGRNGNASLSDGLEKLKDISPRRKDFIPDELGKQISFLCNVYFFSGFFYPKARNVDVRYVYTEPNNPSLLGWSPKGNGPYHRLHFSHSSETAVTMREELQEVTAGALDAKSRVFVFALDNSFDRLPTINDLASILADRITISLEFTRNENHGTPGYTTKANFGRQYLPMGLPLYSEYSIEMGVSGFEVEVTTRRPATSVAEFLTDCFEYAGLFMGVCAYSVLVAPARMYLRHSN